MKSTFGKNINISLFGESHGTAIGVVINGLAPGIALDLDLIRAQLNKRKPKGKISTARQEADEFEIVSGFFHGYTTGTPLCLMIRNQSQHSRDYEKTKNFMRPSHADYTAFEKYRGYQDYRGAAIFPDGLRLHWWRLAPFVCKSWRARGSRSPPTLPAARTFPTSLLEQN